MASKTERLDEFLRRLAAAPVAASDEEALCQIGEILNRVEDELTDIPFDPDAWQDDGRMYPPRADAERSVTEHPRLRRFRSRGHHTIVSPDGAIEILDTRREVVFEKRGASGRTVEDWRNG